MGPRRHRQLFFVEGRTCKAYRGASPEIMMMRAERAERIGLTYEEYTLELLERGRYLQPGDVARIQRIKRARQLSARQK